jgi:hypothetical protein
MDGGSFIISEPSFVMDGGSFVIFEPSFVMDGGSFVIFEPSFVLDGGSFVIFEPSFVVSEPSFIIKEGSFFINGGSFASSEASFVASEASFMDSPARTNPGLMDGLEPFGKRRKEFGGAKGPTGPNERASVSHIPLGFGSGARRWVCTISKNHFPTQSVSRYPAAAL